MTGDSAVASEVFDVLFILQVTPELRLEHVSESILEFTGHQAQEHISEPDLWLSALDLRDHEALLHAFNADPDVVVHLTLRWTRPEVGTKWGHQVTRKVIRPDGSMALYGALSHITDQQIAEAQAGVEGRYSMVADEASDVVLRIDLQGRIVWVSDSVSVIGRSPQDLVGRNAGDFLDAAGRAVVSALAPRVLAGETRSGVVVRIATANGGDRFVSLSARPVFDESTGEPAGAIASWRDVDELVRARIEAESERQILRAALDAQLDPQIVLEAVRDEQDHIVDFVVVEINPAACQAFDVTRADVVGKRALALRPQIQPSEQWSVLLKVVQSRQSLILNEQPLQTILGGHTRRFDLRAVPVHDGLSVTWRDVTERHERAAALAASEARYRLLLEESSDMVTFHDPSGAVEWISPAMERLLGWRPDEVATSVLNLIHRDDAAGIWAARQRLLDAEESATARFRMRALDGGWRWLEATARAVRDADGQVSSLVVFSRDIQERMDYEQALATSEARYRLLAENATDVVYRTALDGTTEWVSEGVQRVLGFTPAEFVGRNGRDLVDPQDREFVDRATVEVLAGIRSSARFRMPTKDGGTRWVESTIHPVYEDGEPVGFVGGWRDVQAEVEVGQELDMRARTDELTGLANRREVIARLTRLLAPDNPRHAGLAVAFCDLDGFKAVNDNRGHAVGDALLQIVADRVRACVRAGDTVGRVGGDEFLLVLDAVADLAAAAHVAGKVLVALREPVVIAGDIIPITVSIGVTMAEIHDDVDGLIARADRAMYEAKQAGRDRVVAT